MNSLKIKNWIQGFIESERGGILPLLAFGMGALVMSSGFAVDYSRGVLVRDRLQNALDAAALAGGRAGAENNNNMTIVMDVARRYFNANFPKGYDTTGTVHISGQKVPNPLNNTGGAYRFTTNDVYLKSNLAGIFGGKNIMVSAKSSVGIAPMEPLDVVLTIDLSGSMNWDDAEGVDCQSSPVPAYCRDGWPAGSRINNAKVAMKNIRNAMDGPNNRFGIIGWDTRVNFGGTYYYGHGTPAPYTGAYPYGPLAPMLMRTTNKTAYMNRVDLLEGEGNTDHANGMLWGIMMFENHHGWGPWPGWTVPGPNKVIIFISDGVNSWDYAINNYANYPTAEYYAAKDRFLFWCNYAKNTLGISVYTILFNLGVDVGNPQVNEVIATMQSCATVPAMFDNAVDGVALNDAFLKIAGEFQTVRLTE